MADNEQIEMKCPRCGERQMTTMWKKLDATADPGVRDALFAWEINIFNCKACDLRAQMSVGLLYTDPAKRLAIQFYPMDDLGSDEFYEGFRRDGEPIAGDTEKENPAPSDMKPHIVFDMAEMMRYIVFREIAFVKGK